jgi:hypothetical protein
MGIPIAALVVVAWLVIFGVLVHGVRVRRRDLIIPIAALAVAMIAVLHSLIDFSLQIPGYSIVALALIGAGLAQSFVSERNRRDAGNVPAATKARCPRTRILKHEKSAAITPEEVAVP